MNIIVTGASRGIGYHTVLQLANLGNHHIVAIARSSNGLKKLEGEFNRTSNAKLSTISFDLSEKDINPLVEQISQAFELEEGNKIDILLNNAGYLANKSFLELTDDDWQKSFEVNVFAIARLTRNIFPHFNTKDGAHIVNIASMGGVQGTTKFPGLSAYSASKGAVNILTEAMATEFENENIRVNAINPGAVQTEMLEEAFPGFKAQTQAQDMAKYIANFITTAHQFMNGRLTQVSLKG
jgi:3-oxoacyl-[acyl-carrier protein] reductase